MAEFRIFYLEEGLKILPCVTGEDVGVVVLRLTLVWVYDAN